jgi:competence ComEA-like helix-hairpin-helix protein
MRGVRLFLILLCVAFLVGGVIHRQRSFKHGTVPALADSSLIVVFQEESQVVLDPDSVFTKIRINDADAKTLIALPGIGEVKAQRIVEYREKHGPFRRAEDLLNVYGIGPKTLEKMKPLIIIHVSDSLEQPPTKP